MDRASTEWLTDAVIDRVRDCQDPRFKTIITSLVKHLHSFVRDVELTEAEWIGAIQFLTATGQACTDKRQEFILLSDTLGVSMLVITLAQERLKKLAPTVGVTEATVQGPYYWQGAPELPLGSDIAQGVKGEPTLYRGRLTDEHGAPIAGGVLDIWSGDGEGTYDMQLPDQTEMLLRGKFRTDELGRYWFWSIRPFYYPVPIDGPVGVMLNKMGRHPNRPGHIHMKVSASGYLPVTTHLFVKDSPYLDSDAVFGVRDSLVVDYEKQGPGVAIDGRSMKSNYYVVNFDFQLQKVAS